MKMWIIKVKAVNISWADEMKMWIISVKQMEIDRPHQGLFLLMCDVTVDVGIV